MFNPKDAQEPHIQIDSDKTFLAIAQAVSEIGELSQQNAIVFDELEGKQVGCDLITRKRIALEYTKEGILLPRTLGVRIGSLIFLDSRLKKQLPLQLLEDTETQFYWLLNFFSQLDDVALRLYSLPTSYALSQLPLTGKHVLDLGAADGTQSLVAYKKGARKVTSVEGARKFRTQETHHDDVLNKEIFDANIVLNNINPDDFSYLHANIETDQDVIVNAAKDAEVVVANIGPGWGNTDIAAIDLLRDLPHATTYILAGYVKEARSGWGENLTKALDRLATYGFTPTRRITTNVLVQTFVLEKTG